jgi:hypothetical protein
MPVSAFTAQMIAERAIAKRDLLSTCALDIVVALAPKFTEDEAANDALIDEYVEARPHILKTPAVKNDESIDMDAERKAFGPDATPQGRGALYRRYGTEFAEQRRAAWGADAGTIKSGKEPGAENHDAATVKKAKQIVDDQFTNSPFNPSKRYLTVETRIADIDRYIKRYGTKAAQKAADHFQVDLAARPLRKRA